MTTTPAEHVVIQRLAAAKEEPVAHVLRRFFDFDGLNAEYERLRRAFLPETPHDAGDDAPEPLHAPKMGENDYSPLANAAPDVGEG